MGATIYNLTDWEQGTITSSGSDSSSNTRIRSIGYTSVSPSPTASYTVVAKDTNNVALRINIMMYDSEYRCIYDSGWYASGSIVNDSHNASYVRIVLSYSSGNISPSNLSECTLEYSDGKTWHIIDNQITNEKFIPQPESYMSKPYPHALWRIDTDSVGFPYNELSNNSLMLGAFANATHLMRVSIPRSCKKIGREAFRNTQLTSVTIAQDCEYYPTSFPDRCVVNFYPD